MKRWGGGGKNETRFHLARFVFLVPGGGAVLRNFVEKALVESDLVGLRIYLSALNYALTHHAGGDFLDDEIARDDLDEKLQAFMHEGKTHGLASLLLYLGDGGYSRVVLIREGGSVAVTLSSVSTSAVKALWEKL